ncbi:MAG TPA: RdgB/HAM1 family non-canonical purine NTP pyrophosphatase [Gammaproteobacteria bacterium]|jgi:XTP/dITP diphosphohydrolase|nr:RdgB/HAM1 family non-canonical purine NTP pyrophosphatase [Gammaproteobacteria bacterium]
MRRVVLATNNAGKAKELNAMLSGLDMEIVPQSALGVPEAEETGLTFIENAILKARNAAAHAQLPAIADDSGLEVDALAGAPGIHSARYAGAGAGDQANLEKLLQAMQDVPDFGRSARFRCVIVYLKHAADPAPLVTEGVWEGSILRAPKGTNGFGYDPVFWVPEKGCSSAELPPEVKNQLSHRGQALARLAAHFRARH